MLDIPKYHPHHLKQQLQALGLSLWQIRELLGGRPSEGKLSRYLNGIESLPKGLERQLKEIVSKLKEGNVDYAN